MPISIDQLKQHVLDQFLEAFKLAFECDPEQEAALGYPPKISFGDFAIACFPFAKQLKKNPKDIAFAIASELKPTEYISVAQAVGPYVNVSLVNSEVFGAVCRQIHVNPETFGNSDFGAGEKVMVEYLSPNTNKPLHLGHVRNGVLGMSVSNLLEATGHTVVKASLVNDRGVHICKSMFAYQRWGNGATPESAGKKGDHFVGDLYVLYSKKSEKLPEFEKDVQDMLRKWEDGNPEIMDLWSLMNEWVYEGFNVTNSDYGFLFDAMYYESKTYKLGSDIVERGLNNGVFVAEDNGSVVVYLPKGQFGLNKDNSKKFSVLRREDGTSLYLTQDLGTAVLKFQDHALTQSIYVVADEQNHHFKVLFATLKMLGYEWADSCKHLSYGMVNLPEGRMKSREGTTVDADDLLEDVKQLVSSEIKKKLEERESDSIDEDEIERRSTIIALAAIKFFLLRISPDRSMKFDPKESISFEGETGPYCQYTYARCQSILRNAHEQSLGSHTPDFSKLGNEEERGILRFLFDFPNTVSRAAQQFSPSLLCSWAIDCSRAINRFYQKHKVLDDKVDPGLISARLALIDSSAQVLKRGLELLGIETVEEM